MARKSDWLIFVDTNILLDFYRLSGDAAERHLSALERHKDALILTDQVWMEYLKNRQKVILEALKDIKRPEVVKYPPIVAGHQQAKMVAAHIEKARKSSEWVKDKIASILEDPARHDFVYRQLSRLFKHKGPYALHRENKVRFEMRRLARKRFILGYPPRKAGDTSIGDAINWEWMIACVAKSPSSNDLLIVSRDADYGATHGQRYFVNDWLKREFGMRLSNRRRLELTGRLTVALKRLEEAVTPEDEKEEAELIGPVVNLIGLGGKGSKLLEILESFRSGDFDGDDRTVQLWNPPDD